MASPKFAIYMTLVGLTAMVVVVVMGLQIATLTTTSSVSTKLDAIVPPAQWVEGTCAGDVDEVRRLTSYNHRVTTAYAQYIRPIPCHTANGDEQLYANTRAASFSKGLPHDANGHVNPGAYAQLLLALQTGLPAHYDAIPLGPGAVRKLDNPQAGNAYTLVGADSRSLHLPPAPAFSSAEMASELVEDYWMALLRDVSFANYGTHALAAAAIADLNAMSDFRGPRPVTPGNLFRGSAPGCALGPYISQFLYLPCPFGAATIDQRMVPPQAVSDFMTTLPEWLNIQQGGPPSFSLAYNTTPVFIRNGRDLAGWVHIDALYQAYMHSLLILLDLGAPLKASIPYQTDAGSMNQRGFGTWGGPFLIWIMGTVTDNALKSVWYQKWNVHRRLRPEAFAHRVHAHKTASYTYAPGPHSDVLNSAALPLVFAAHGTYLLPQAYPEGSPVHPSYGAGHATVAGACTTILKAMFNEDTVIANPVQPSPGGTTTVPYSGPDVLTVGGELNKIAYNVALGRDHAGVHYRSDGTLMLGQQVAVELLRDIKVNYPEAFGGFTFVGFDGVTVVV